MRRHWREMLVLLLGAWLSLSPFFLIYPSAKLTFQLAGIAVMLFAALALVEFRAWEAWMNLTIGASLVSAPMAFGFAGVDIATWNLVLVGSTIVVSALSALTQSDRLPTEPL